jgi:hypothetical protein
MVSCKKRLKRRREDKHEPTRTLRKQPHRSTEDETGNELQSPGEAERSVSLDVCLSRSQLETTMVGGGKGNAQEHPYWMKYWMKVPMAMQEERR